MAQGRAQSRRCREHGGNSGQNTNVQRLRFGPIFQRFKHGRGHGKHPRITRRNDNNLMTLRCHFQSMARAIKFNAVV